MDTVHSGIEMKEVSMAIRYGPVSLLEDRMEIMLPAGFREMPEEMAKWKKGRCSSCIFLKRENRISR